MTHTSSSSAPLGFWDSAGSDDSGFDTLVSGHPLLAALYDLWRRDGDGGHPPRKLDPLDMPARLLPFVALIDVSAEKPHGCIRLAGTGLCQGFGRELRGSRLDDLFDPAEAGVIRRHFETALADGRAQIGACARTLSDGRHCSATRLTLPLAPDGTHATRLLVALDPGTLRIERANTGSHNPA